MRLFSAQAMREADQKAAAMGMSTLRLMEAAGRAVADYVQKHFDSKVPVVVLADKGNNGGDGLVAARFLTEKGYTVEVFAEQGQQGDALVVMRSLETTSPHGLSKAQLAIHPLSDWVPRQGTLVIDALFGTGLTRPLEGLHAKLVEDINTSGVPVIAVDVPSGLPYSPHVKATTTLALAGLKHEHLFFPARSACGQIVLADIGMPPELLENPGLPELLVPDSMRGLLPRREGDAHKGSVGRVLVVGGCDYYRGAPALAALGAYRAGAGLVSVAHPREVAMALPLEAVHLPLEVWSTSGLKQAKAEAVAAGMGAGEKGLEAAFAVLGLGLPTVLDADALYPDVVRAYAKARLPVVITPHPGEASRLLGSKAPDIASNPLEAARELAFRYKVTVVLKGGPSVVAGLGPDTEHARSDTSRMTGGTNAAVGVERSALVVGHSALGIRRAVNTTGNPAMASGGMGDVLSGVIAALLAAGLPPWDSARLGVYLHGLAGDRINQVGMLAHEVADQLPHARALLENNKVKAFWQPE